MKITIISLALFLITSVVQAGTSEYTAPSVTECKDAVDIVFVLAEKDSSVKNVKNSPGKSTEVYYSNGSTNLITCNGKNIKVIETEPTK